MASSPCPWASTSRPEFRRCERSGWSRENPTDKDNCGSPVCMEGIEHKNSCRSFYADPASGEVYPCNCGAIAGCTCVEIMLVDKTRHFKECPERAKYPDPPTKNDVRAMRATLIKIAEHLQKELADGYVLTQEPLAGERWRARRNELLAEVERFTEPEKKR